MCYSVCLSHTHSFTFTRRHAGVVVIYFENVTSFLLLWRNGILPSIQADISTLNASCSLFKVCVCACYQTESVCWWICVFFLEGVNRNLFRRFSISAGVAQRERKIRLPAARYYLLPPPIYHSFSGRGGSAACFRLTTVHLREPQSSVFLPQLKALPVSHCFSHSDVASEG